MNKSKKIIFTGGSGRFGKIFISLKYKHKIYFPTKKQFNVLKISNMKKYLKNKKPKYLIHAAGLSRPMSIHNKILIKVLI